MKKIKPLIISISAFAIELTEGKTADETAFLSAIFTQLGAETATIAAAKTLEEKQNAKKTPSTDGA